MMNRIDKLILEQEEWKTSGRKEFKQTTKPNSLEAVGDKVFSPLNMAMMAELGWYSLGLTVGDFGTKFVSKRLQKRAVTAIGQKFLKHLATNGVCTIFVHPYAIGGCVFAKNAYFAAEMAYAAGTIGYWSMRSGKKGTAKIPWADYDPTVFMKRAGLLKKSISGAEDPEIAKLAKQYNMASKSIKSNTPIEEEIVIRNARLVTGVPQFQTVKKLGKWQIFDNREKYNSMSERLELCADTNIPHFVTKQKSSKFIEVPTDLETWKKEINEQYEIDDAGLAQIEWPKVKRYLHECLTDKAYIDRYASKVPAIIRYVQVYKKSREQGETPEEIWKWASMITPGEAEQSLVTKSKEQDISNHFGALGPYACVMGNSKEKFQSVVDKLITLSNSHPDYRWMEGKILKNKSYRNCKDHDWEIVKAIMAFQQENSNSVMYQNNGKYYIDTGHANKATMEVLNQKIDEIPEKN